ncbi:hypothetical protein ACFQX8_12110 [Klenkia terrae]|uniref:hypothetical protein n=1 Tax=Klenkia terrae TaxID=1052259 RepID=UPI00360C755F
MQATLVGLQQSADRQDLLERARTVTAHRATAVQAAGRAADARGAEHTAADRLARTARDAVVAAGRTGEHLAALAERAAAAGVPDPCPARSPPGWSRCPGSSRPCAPGRTSTPSRWAGPP